MNFCMVIDWIGAGNKTPDAAQLCMFYSAPPASSTQAALTYYEFRTSLEIKDAVENFCLILMDMFQERIGHRDFFFAEIFEMMKSTRAQTASTMSSSITKFEASKLNLMSLQHYAQTVITSIWSRISIGVRGLGGGSRVGCRRQSGTGGDRPL